MYFNDDDIKYLKSIFSGNKKILLITHDFPDGDAVGSIIACENILKNLSKDLRVYSFVNTDIPESYEFLLEDFNCFPKKEISSANFDICVVLDCGNIDRIGNAKEIEGLKIINIDHHGDNTMFGEKNYVFSSASSTCEILFYLAEALLSLPLNKKISRALYTGIVTDTGGFKFSCTSAMTHYAASMLYESKNANLQQVIEKIYFNEPFNKMKLLGEILSGMKLDSGICYSYISKEIWEKTKTNPKMVEGLVNFMASISDAKVAVLFQELPDKVKVSLRSRGDINCREIAHKFNGGGHIQAAGVKFPLPLEDAIEKLINYIKEKIL